MSSQISPISFTFKYYSLPFDGIELDPDKPGAFLEEFPHDNHFYLRVENILSGTLLVSAKQGSVTEIDRASQYKEVEHSYEIKDSLLAEDFLSETPFSINDQGKNHIRLYLLNNYSIPVDLGNLIMGYLMSPMKRVWEKMQKFQSTIISLNEIKQLHKNNPSQDLEFKAGSYKQELEKLGVTYISTKNKTSSTEVKKTVRVVSSYRSPLDF